nr:hypothetical protein [Clostridium tyrobutyricum]
MEIYDKSHQNYGAPKIAKKIQKSGEKISERTVGCKCQVQNVEKFQHENA